MTLKCIIILCFPLEGIPGVKVSLLEEFGVRLVTYDLPGFGESDPHPNRSLSSSALDILHLANAVAVTDKFWLLGYSSGAMHAWAALKHIPNRIAGDLSLKLIIYVMTICTPTVSPAFSQQVRGFGPTW